MTSWTSFVRACTQRHGVGSTCWAQAAGVRPRTFLQRTKREDWEAPYPSVRVLPETTTNVHTDVLAFCASTTVLTAASGPTALWLHGLRARPPGVQHLLATQSLRQKPAVELDVRRARWLRPDDVTVIDTIPVLDVPATLISLAAWRRWELLAVVLDALQQDRTTLEVVRERLARVGPVTGRATLVDLVGELDERRSESIFDDEGRRGLERRGYQPSAVPRRIDTPDGRGLIADILLPWLVAVEPEGDAFHRTRAQRRNDRRRIAQYGGTDVEVVPVDWVDWVQGPDRVFAAIDAAILKQWDRGVGREHTLPPHLATHA